MDNTTPQSGRISRRTIVKGTAWSVPVIAVAIKTPMAAATGGGQVALTSAWYSCNNGTWKFTFTPSATVAVTGVSVTATWAGCGTLSETLKATGKAGKPVEAEMKAKVGSCESKSHYTTPDGPCALDHLKADNTVFLVSLSDGTTETVPAATFTGSFVANHADNCGPCGGTQPATGGASLNKILYSGNVGKWEFDLQPTNDKNKITNIALWGDWGTGPILLGSNKDGKFDNPVKDGSSDDWRQHYGSTHSLGNPNRCPLDQALADDTFFVIIYQDRSTETVSLADLIKPTTKTDIKNADCSGSGAGGSPVASAVPSEAKYSGKAGFWEFKFAPEQKGAPKISTIQLEITIGGTVTPLGTASGNQVKFESGKQGAPAQLDGMSWPEFFGNASNNKCPRGTLIAHNGTFTLTFSDGSTTSMTVQEFFDANPKMSWGGGANEC